MGDMPARFWIVVMLLMALAAVAVWMVVTGY